MQAAKKEKHVNIPIFVVHMGCPNQCVFCDQRLISGTSCFSEESVRCQIETVLSALPANKHEVEIAFFGGSFTGIDRPLMIRLLNTAEEYVRAGDVSGIRFSTRPDYIDREVLSVLSDYTVTAAELGIQSISDSVLHACRRGHTKEDTERAVSLLKEAGIPFVGQMMVGLPGSSFADEIRTAEYIASAGAQAFRLYPTVVFQKTELADMTARGLYTPLSVEAAVDRMAGVLDVFDRSGIPCLRAGLCESSNLHDTDSYLAGPNHPAIGELARSALLFKRVCEHLNKMGDVLRGACIVWEVPRGCASLAAGQNRRNLCRLYENYGIKNVKILENDALLGYNSRIGVLCK